METKTTHTTSYEALLHSISQFIGLGSGSTAEYLLERASTAITQLTTERDAAVKDLKRICAAIANTGSGT